MLWHVVLLFAKFYNMYVKLGEKNEIIIARQRGVGGLIKLTKLSKGVQPILTVPYIVGQGGQNFPKMRYVIHEFLDFSVALY